MDRTDISKNLIHWTKGDTPQEAFDSIFKIVGERRLMGKIKNIKGSHRCVCFSESPLNACVRGLVNETGFSNYSEFGIMVEKKWLFARGGRPVIYQPDSEYGELPDSHSWRHVKYEIRDEKDFMDWTWEREWRIKCDFLSFDHLCSKIVVPDKEWAEQLTQAHCDLNDCLSMQYAGVIGESLARQFFDAPFKWEVVSLK